MIKVIDYMQSLNIEEKVNFSSSPILLSEIPCISASLAAQSETYAMNTFYLPHLEKTE